MRFTLFLLVAVMLFLAGGIVQAQEVTTDAQDDPEIPQAERICDVEIDEVEAILDKNLKSFGGQEQVRLHSQLEEAQAYCDDGNEVMAAIRLEAVTAVIEVTGAAE